MEPLFPNPGGTVDPDDLVGRTSELQRLHEAVVRSGAHVTGERRMGKTSLLAKLADELTAAGRVVVRLSAETSDVHVFADRLVRELRQHKLIRRRIERWEKEIKGEVSLSILKNGVKLSGTAKRQPNAEVGLDLIDVIAEANDQGGAVLIIDEITVLCHALGAAAATEFLSGLRAQRQSDRSLSLVISGSVGLHHAIPDDRVIADLWRVEVGPLTADESRELTQRLLLGIGMPDSQTLIGDVVAATSGIPYYIQAVVDRLRSQPNLPISTIVERSITENDWHTAHYVTRLTDYYGKDGADLARSVLDEYALTYGAPLTVKVLQSRLVGRDPAPSRDELLDLLDRLQRDHYLVRDGMDNQMSSELLATIWRLHRRLT